MRDFSIFGVNIFLFSNSINLCIMSELMKIIRAKNKKTGTLPPSKKRPSFSSYISGALFIFLALSLVYSLISGTGNTVKSISLSEVARSITQGEIKKIEVDGNTLNIEKKDGTKLSSKKESDSSLSDSLSKFGVSSDKISAVDVSIKESSGFSYFLLNILPILLPILILVFFVWMLTRQMKGAGMQAFTFGQSKAKLTNPDDKNSKVTFKDVAGSKEAKEELKEIVDFLRNPKKFLDIGARIPKGVILTGAPGTGKTLLARAVAGEASVPFFHLSGSEFVEMFFGVGASRVRDLFKMATKAAPAIIFVDEIDAIGRTRGGGFGGGND